MSSAEAQGIGLPKPELSEADVKAIRSSFPGKLLGRMTVLAMLVGWLLIPVLGLDQALRHLLGPPRPPWLYDGLVLGVFALAAGWHLYLEWRAKQAQRRLRSLAVKAIAVPHGYFRIGPYLDTAEDRARFDRADRAHEKVLDWVKRSTSVPLYLTGDSGSGKSSLLNAFVLPALREEGWTIVEARAWQDPEAELRDKLLRLSGARRRPPDETDLSALIEAAARRCGVGLLLVLDQFEEFLILGKPEQQQSFAARLGSLSAAPCPKLRLLLALRSEYQNLLEDLSLPPLRHGENFYLVGRFTLAAAERFMVGSGLGLQPGALSQVLNSAAVLDETPGLVRPITLNVIGYVLGAGPGTAPSLEAGQLVRLYIEQTVGPPENQAYTLPVLEKLVTEQGSKQPRSEQELVAATGLPLGQVRVVLITLANAALARPLDAEQGVWELSHDFIARAVSRYLGRRRRDWVRSGVFYAVPTLTALTLLIGGAAIAWDVWDPLQTRLELAELGITLTPTNQGLAGEANSRISSESSMTADGDFAKVGPLLDRLAGANAVTALNLSGTHITDLTPLKNLTGLRTLNLSKTHIIDLTPLKNLTALRTLILNETRIRDLEPLRGLTGLTTLGLYKLGKVDVAPIAALSRLEALDLSWTYIRDLEPLRALTTLHSLDLAGTDVERGQLWTKVEDLEPLRGLTALRRLNLSWTHVQDLEPLRGLTALDSLSLSGTTPNLESIRGLTALRSLELDETQVDLAPLKGLAGL
ncbi:MAG: leucine-rich repeat domain-containing protein, partial [Acetobacteraceae bacterium]|nr:leucine-rich repeat domain-containing protein [Acetobacteraceae bacterium]